jgi:hypothetical protein
MNRWHQFWVKNLSAYLDIGDSVLTHYLLYPIWRTVHGLEWKRLKDTPSHYRINRMMAVAGFFRGSVMLVSSVSILAGALAVMAGRSPSIWSELSDRWPAIPALAYALLDWYVVRQYSGPRIPHMYHVRKWVYVSVVTSIIYAKYVRRSLEGTQIEERAGLSELGMARTDCMFTLHTLFWDLVSVCAHYWDPERSTPPASVEHFSDSCLSIDVDDKPDDLLATEPVARYTSTIRAVATPALMCMQPDFSRFVSLIKEGCYDAGFMRKAISGTYDREAWIRNVVYDDLTPDDLYTTQHCTAVRTEALCSPDADTEWGTVFRFNRFGDCQLSLDEGDVGFACRISTPRSADVRAVYIVLMKHATYAEPLLSVLYDLRPKDKALSIAAAREMHMRGILNDLAVVLCRADSPDGA